LLGFDRPFFCLAGATPGTIARAWAGGGGERSSVVGTLRLTPMISVAR